MLGNMLRIRILFGIAGIVFWVPSTGFAEINILQAMEKQFQEIAHAVKPSVVEVVGTREIRELDRSESDHSRGVINSSSFYHSQNIGSGIIISSNGHIATTCAVVSRMDKIEITYADGRREAAELVGIDPWTDIAVLRVRTVEFPRTPLGNSDEIKAGAWVMTLGSSYGKCSTLAFGIVNGRETLPTQPFCEAIQINVALTPGNSGGAVANTSGEVIGLITGTLARDVRMRPVGELAEPQEPSSKICFPRNISFALPINAVESIARELIEHGTVRRGWLGVSVAPHVEGVQITQVLDESPAEKAGLLRGDIILAFNGARVKSYVELNQLVASLRPETHATIAVQRQSQRVTSEVILGRRN